jgi:hypothetical protein
MIKEEDEQIMYEMTSGFGNNEAPGGSIEEQNRLNGGGEEEDTSTYNPRYD